MTRAMQAERQEAIALLREWVKPGDTVYTILRHVSRSRMQREIGVVLIQSGATLHPDYLISVALGDRIGKHDGIIMGGWGMDMGFALIYNLGCALYPEGFGCSGDTCPSNDHSNGDRDRTPHNADHQHWHGSGGFALRQRWL